MARLDREHADPFLRARLRTDRRFRLELEQARAYGVSHSVFTGRAVQPGEPQFLREDTDGALALAEEEADTCPQCGLLRVWCRDPGHQFHFDADESVCWPTYRLALRRNSTEFQGYDEATQRAVQLVPRFREGQEPDLLAGLDLGD